MTISAADAIARARSQIGLKTIYQLGHGGMDPTSPTAADAEHKCDCTGFLPWCLKQSRHNADPFYDFNGGWMNAAAIFRDAHDPKGIFTMVDWEDGRPGDILVFAAVPHGHVGLVSEADESGPTRVIHCSSGNYRALKDAIAETDPGVFIHNDGIVARCAWVNPA